MLLRCFSFAHSQQWVGQTYCRVIISSPNCIHVSLPCVLSLPLYRISPTKEEKQKEKLMVVFSGAVSQ